MSVWALGGGLVLPAEADSAAVYVLCQWFAGPAAELERAIFGRLPACSAAQGPAGRQLMEGTRRAAWPCRCFMEGFEASEAGPHKSTLWQICSEQPAAPDNAGPSWSLMHPISS